MKLKTFLPVFLMILLIPFASASFFDWFTGKASEETATTDQAVEAASEQITCIFLDSSSMQECYSAGFKCSGIGSCTVAVSGAKGTQLTWKSSCGNYAYTSIDGTDKKAEFKCLQSVEVQPIQTTQTATSTAIETLKEQVKCIFINSVSEQKCYTTDGKFGCSGMGSCISDVASAKGTQLQWKSSCGGYAYTTIDGSNEYAEFKCLSAETIQPTATSTQVVEPKPPISTQQTTGTAVPIVTASSQAATTVSQPATATAVQTATTQAATTTRPIIKEQVKCVFYNSDALINPSTARNEKCYSDDGFVCEGSGNMAEEQLGDGKIRRYSYCVADVYDQIDRKLTWKSTCGGYAYTVMDGNNEDAAFKCVPSEQVTSAQIMGKGFRSAYWQCYDKAEQKQVVSGSVACRSSDAWQKEAENFCKGHCYDDGSKCGVNSFSISGECYLEAGKEGIVISPPIAEESMAIKEAAAEQMIEKAEKTGVKENVETAVETKAIFGEKKEEMLICKDSCPIDGKCYPFGYRKKGDYCSDEGAFKLQFKGESACDNNFECLSNVCIDSKCVSQAMIKRIMDWFGKLFS